MTTVVNDIVIVGGGSSGWITAASLVTQLKNKKITVIESPNIPTIGVGESTVGGIRAWLRMVGISDRDFMKHCDATYKIAIKFNNFYNGSGTWYYPFGTPCTKGTVHGVDDWFIKKALYPNIASDDYMTCMYSQMALVNENKLDDKNTDLDNFEFYNDTAFHFDAAKLGAWLRDSHCKPLGVNHIVSEVKSVVKNQDGIQELIIESGETISADLYIDCTGFKSMLLEQELGVPFKSYADVLPNNRAWAAQIQYNDKEIEINSVTDCTALDNGWVWSIPLWSRLGTGYAYSDKYVSPEQAKQDFIKYLKTKGYETDGSNFRDIHIKAGIHDQLWYKNVVALGLSAAFIEPLESSGLLTTHEFAKTLCSVLSRGSYSQWDRDEFNLKCTDEFMYWLQFVSMHYSLSHRTDSKYWRDIGEKSYVNLMPSLNKLHTQSLYTQSIYQKNFVKSFQNDPGVICLSAGMNWNIKDLTVLKSSFPPNTNLHVELDYYVEGLENRKNKWKRAVASAPSTYQYLKDNIYKD